MTDSDVVQAQLEAYNARDLEGFAATYSDDIKIYRMPATEPAIIGKAQLRDVYRDRFKSCAVDTDCEVVTYAPRCNAMRAYAVASAELDGYGECAPDSPCERATAGRAEDGRSIADVEALSDVQPRCIDGMCEARVHTRVCGSAKLVCNEVEICVSLLNAMGTLEYQCTSNPCLGEVLDCSCAASVCKSGDRVVRVCTIEQIEDADIYCKAEGR